MGVSRCYESHSPNKFLMVVYGDSIVNGISCHHRAIHDVGSCTGRSVGSCVLIGWAGLAVG